MIKHGHVMLGRIYYQIGKVLLMSAVSRIKHSIVILRQTTDMYQMNASTFDNKNGIF